MPAQATDANPSPAEFGAAEPTPSHEDMGEAAASNHAAGAEGQVARAASDCPGATAPSPWGMMPSGIRMCQNRRLILKRLSENPGPRKQHPRRSNGRRRGIGSCAGAEGQFARAVSDRPEATATRQGVQVQFTEELLRLENDTLGSARRKYTLDSAVASEFKGMVARTQFGRELWKPIPLPTCGEEYGSTRALFDLVRETIAAQTHLAEKDSALLAYGSSRAGSRIFSVAPGISISGWADEANLVLRTLRAICRHPILLAGLTNATLANIDWKLKPTLIISDPGLSKQMAVFLSSSTCRGYLVPRKKNGYPGDACDFFGSKAIFVGEEPSMKPMLQNFLHINASPTPRLELQHALPMSDEMIQRMQNQLLHYRMTNLPMVVRSDFCASGLSAETNAIATALGKCIVDAPEIQGEIVSLLESDSEQQMAERRDSLVMVAVGAALSICHQGKIEILAGAVASEANRMQTARGERLRLSAERAGHLLKRAGLHTRRLSSAGNGLQMDHATQVLLHQVAAAYGCVSSADGDENLHCPLCEQNK